jgi:hypothetical protein
MSIDWRQRLVEFESIVTLLATYAGGFLPPLLLGVVALAEGFGHGKLPFFVILVSLAAVTAVSAVWVSRMAHAALAVSCPGLAKLLGVAWRAVRHPEDQLPAAAPLAVVMAVRLPCIPWLLRPLVGLWWGAHFAGAAALAILVNQAMDEILKHAPMHQQVLLPLTMDLALLFAANLYLLLAVAVFFRNPAVHARLWSWRFVIDLVLVLVAWGLAVHG